MDAIGAHLSPSGIMSKAPARSARRLTPTRGTSLPRGRRTWIGIEPRQTSSFPAIPMAAIADELRPA
jgi:hypothetical protein